MLTGPAARRRFGQTTCPTCSTCLTPVEVERAGWPLPITDRIHFGFVCLGGFAKYRFKYYRRMCALGSFLIFFSLAASPVEGMVFPNVVGFIGWPHFWPLHDSCHCR